MMYEASHVHLVLSMYDIQCSTHVPRICVNMSINLRICQVFSETQDKQSTPKSLYLTNSSVSAPKEVITQNNLYFVCETTSISVHPLCSTSNTSLPLSRCEKQKMDPLNITTAAHGKQLGMTDEKLDATQLIEPENRRDLSARQSWIPQTPIDSDGLDNFDTTDNASEADSVGTLLAVELDLDETTDLPANPQANGSDRDGADRPPQDCKYVALKGLDWDDLPERMPNWIMAALMSKTWRLAMNQKKEIEIEVSDGRSDLVAWLTDILTNEASREKALMRAPIGGDGKEAIADEASRLKNAHQ